ncbi:hypothetical protein B0T26DRAFT_674298 [Lasiosphaeria miniovina]|uniref:Uncharacterized protein n=1 Tax=Lasiosphaeria miniovina TaxID=1954250 RepID=A0AA40DZS5_9PEZI|nr:uncharacterized protein B0T26DRAFT_674298 [Lasiosphaeria miniovina]KAK0722614.1 hypothetical protein B0T26DRAFT_674298 [Lasiosphaeria miniovina]
MSVPVKSANRQHSTSFVRISIAMKLFAPAYIAVAMMASSTRAWTLKMYDNPDGTVQIHGSGGSSDFSCWNMVGTSYNNKASYVSWSVPAGQRCTIFFYDDGGCSTWLGQYTASFNSALPSQLNNKISSYRIDC